MHVFPYRRRALQDEVAELRDRLAAGPKGAASPSGASSEEVEEARRRLEQDQADFREQREAFKIEMREMREKLVSFLNPWRMHLLDSRSSVEGVRCGIITHWLAMLLFV